MKFQWIGLLAGALVGMGGTVVWNRFSDRSPHDSPPAEAAGAPAASEGPDAASVLQMSQAKRKASQIAYAEAVERTMIATQTVPARLGYDDTRHVDIKVPTSGRITDICVKPGDAVEEGNLLAILNSFEIGSARADVLQRQADVALAQEAWDRKKEIREGLEQLVAAVREGRPSEVINEELADIRLGDDRGTILEAYARFRLAESLTEQVAGLGTSGALSGKTVKQRRSERDAAEAVLNSVIEQAVYRAEREDRAARAELDDATRRLQVGRQHVDTLLGYHEETPSGTDSQSLSAVEMRAAFDGTVEAKLVSASEQVGLGETILTIADTSQLWLAADVREPQWAALSLQPGTELQVSAPALPDDDLKATVHYLGREVDPLTNAVPLVATIANPAGRLRPGQFMRVTLPLGASRRVVAVPESAIVEHDGQAFLFLATGDGYRRVNVEVGLQDGEWVEVISGVVPGDRVVTQGAFYLKSELLLAGEDS